MPSALAIFFAFSLKNERIAAYEKPTFDSSSRLLGGVSGVRTEK
jgi:hypothetical protein